MSNELDQLRLDRRRVMQATAAAACALLLPGTSLAEDTPRKGGTLRIAMPYNPGSVDPMTGRNLTDFNVLYGVPPMFMFDRKLWETTKARFVSSYQNTCPHIRRVGYQEMTDHQFLTPDRNVQQTHFGNGVVITVNFGLADYALSDGRVLKSMSYLADGE